MIVPMKKVSIIVEAKDSERAMGELRSLGVLHVEHQNPPQGKEISAAQDEIALIGKVLGILSEEEFSARNMKEDIKDLGAWPRIAKHIVDLRNRFDQLKEYSAAMRSGMAQWETWGDFNPLDIARFAEKGVYIRLYQIPVKDVKDFPASVIVKIVSISKGIANCVAISREKIDVPFMELTLPKMGLAEMRRRLAENDEVVAALKVHLERHARYYDDFMRIRKIVEKELELSEALYGMGHAETIAYIVGYVPADRTKAVMEAAESKRWGILVRDPKEDDNVPTFLRNPRWVSIIEPMFRLMEIIPGYKELDISPLFLLFLSLFFGMIIGDAGYGVSYMALTAFAHRKLGKKFKDAKIFFLLYLFSASAVMWGILTGTVFGQEWYLKAGMRPLLPILNDTKFLQALCFFIGAFHLTLGQGWQAMRKLPSITALSDVGWISVLWAGFFLARMLILDYPLPAVTKWLIMGGIALVIFFSNPQKNILKTVGAGLGVLALSIISAFTDVVSYIRLFAVGLAGVAISDTVNTLAATFGGSSPIAQVMIIFIGHAFTLMLGPISVLVHGVRLNVLEFSSHAGLSWSGTAYKPLKET